MIKFIEFGAKNFGHYKKFTHRINGDVLGLSGVSGAGKSTILQLLEWLTTGTITKPGVTREAITEWVRRSEHEEIKKMEGWADMEVDGKPLRIERAVSLAGTSTRRLLWDGEEKKGAAEVDALMTALFGADQKVIAGLVYIRQGSFGQLFSGLDTERREFFVRLLALGHLEKIGGVIEGYRKSLLGSVQDMSAVRDQADTAYRQAVSLFEQAEHEISRMKSYTKEIDALVQLSGAMDRRDTAEVTLTTHTNALHEGLVALNLTTIGADEFLSEGEQTLVKLREELQTVNSRRRARVTYTESRQTMLNSLQVIEQWLLNKDRRDAFDLQIAKLSDADSKPDPRIRIGQLERWEAAHREREALLAADEGLPGALGEAQQRVVDTKAALAEATLAAADHRALWVKATGDLNELQELQAASAHTTDGQQCKVCGNEHPDPKFLETAITNTKTLVDKLHDEGLPLMDASRAAEAALQEAYTHIRAVEDRRVASVNNHARVTAALQGAPPLAACEEERAILTAELPAYDAAKSMRTHLTAQRDAIQLGDASHTQVELDALKVEIGMVEQMLQGIPTHEALDEENKRLTTAGTQLKEKCDRIRQLRDNHISASATFHTQTEAVAAMTRAYATEVPFLMSSAAALGPITTASLAAVMVDLRERQSVYDKQRGIVDAATQSMNNANAALMEIELKIAEQQNRIIIGKELEAVRAAFLPTGITTDYLSHQFERIAVAAQDHLAQMSADFMVVSSEQRALSFDFLRLNEAGGAWLPQNRMSGGQQVKLAIAVILAIHELIIPQVGMLVLDEPSTHLDMDSRVALAEVLKEIGRRGNFQLVVCDHSPELKDAYTDTIELSAEATTV